MEYFESTGLKSKSTIQMTIHRSTDKDFTELIKSKLEVGTIIPLNNTPFKMKILDTSIVESDSHIIPTEYSVVVKGELL